MSYRIANNRPIAVKAPPKKEDAYLDFIRTLPCVVTGSPDVHAAHFNTANEEYGHNGRAKDRRSSDRWSLPLHWHTHLYEQHDMVEIEFWEKHGINPYVLCLTLYGLWTEMGSDAHQLACKIIERARM